MDINKVQFQCELEGLNTEEWTVQCLQVIFLETCATGHEEARKGLDGRVLIGQDLVFGKLHDV